MSEFPQANTDEGDIEEIKPGQRDSPRTSLIWFVSVFVVILFLIIGVSFGFKESADQMNFLTVNILSLFALAVVIASAITANKQREVMRNQEIEMTSQRKIMQAQLEAMKESLVETRNTIQQNERAIEVSQNQALIAEQSLVQGREFFELVERPSLGIRVQHFQPMRDGSININIRIFNSGKAPAVKVETITQTNIEKIEDVLENACPEPSIDGELEGIRSRNVVPVNGFIESIISIDPEDVPDMFNRKVWIFLWVKVKYQSLTGAEYFVEFYGRNNIDASSFDICQCNNEAN